MKNKPLYASLTKRIEIREVSNVPDVVKGLIETTYIIKSTVWGSVNPLSTKHASSVFIRDMQVENVPTHIIKIRVNKKRGVTRQGLQGNMYLYVKDNDKEGRSFRILCPIDEQDRGIELNILAKEMGLQFGTDVLI